MIVALSPDRLPAGTSIVAPAAMNMSILHKHPNYKTKSWEEQCAKAAMWLKSRPVGKRAIVLGWLLGWTVDPKDIGWGEVPIDDLIDKGLSGRPQLETDRSACERLARVLGDEGVTEVDVTYCNVEASLNLQGQVIGHAWKRLADPQKRLRLPAEVAHITPQSLQGKYGWDGQGYWEARLIWERWYNQEVFDAAILYATAPLAKLGLVVNSPGWGSQGRFLTHDCNGWPCTPRRGVQAPQCYLPLGNAGAALGVNVDRRWLSFLITCNWFRAMPGCTPVFCGPGYSGVREWHLRALCRCAAEAGVKIGFLYNGEPASDAPDTAVFERAAACMATTKMLPAEQLQPIPYTANRIVFQDGSAVTSEEYVERFKTP